VTGQASRPGHFTTSESASGTYSTRGWVGGSQSRESDPGRPTRNLVTILTELCRLPI